MAQSALRVDHRDIEPAVVGPKTRGPDDRADLAALEVELPPCGGGNPRRCAPRWRVDDVFGVIAAGPIIEGVQQSLELQVGQREHVAQPAGKQGAAITYGRPPA